MSFKEAITSMEVNFNFTGMPASASRAELQPANLHFIAIAPRHLQSGLLLCQEHLNFVFKVHCSEMQVLMFSMDIRLPCSLTVF